MKKTKFFLVLLCLYPPFCYGIKSCCFFSIPSIDYRPPLILPPIPEEKFESILVTKKRKNMLKKAKNVRANSFLPKSTQKTIYSFLELNDLMNLVRAGIIDRSYFYKNTNMTLQKRNGTYTEEQILEFLSLHLIPVKDKEDKIVYYLPNPNIHTIHIKGQPLTQNILSSMAGYFPNVKNLTITKGELNDKCLEIIASFKKLSHLKLNGWNNTFTDIGLRALETLTKLTYLYLSGSNNSFTDTGLIALAALTKNLTYLYLQGSNNRFTDTGLIALAAVTKNFTHLSLHGLSNTFTDEGLLVLAAVTKNLTYLYLDGSNNSFTDTGLLALAVLTNLTYLSLHGSNNSFTDTGLRAILGILKKLTYCVYKHHKRFTNEGLNLRPLQRQRQRQRQRQIQLQIQVEPLNMF
jgi:hypothetical protein